MLQPRDPSVSHCVSQLLPHFIDLGPMNESHSIFDARNVPMATSGHLSYHNLCMPRLLTSHVAYLKNQSECLQTETTDLSDIGNHLASNGTGDGCRSQRSKSYDPYCRCAEGPAPLGAAPWEKTFHPYLRSIPQRAKRVKRGATRGTGVAERNDNELRNPRALMENLWSCAGGIEQNKMLQHFPRRTTRRDSRRN